MTVNQIRSVSIIIPTFNEAEGIANTIRSIQDSISEFPTFEIIVVDDNSTDGTAQVVKEFTFNDPRVVCISRDHGRSLGASVGVGVRAAKHDAVVVMDADLTHDPAYIPKMVDKLNVWDVVIGSRFIRGGSMPKLGHYLSSRVFNLFIRATLQTKVSDNLSGFLVFKKENFSNRISNAIFYGYGDFAIRLILYFNRKGLHITEIPISYKLRTHGRSKSNFLKLLFKYGFATFQALWIRF